MHRAPHQCTVAFSTRGLPSRTPKTTCPPSPLPVQLVEVAPRLGQLRQLLWRAPYGLQDEQEDQGEGEQAGGAAGWTFDQLLDEVQVGGGGLWAGSQHTNRWVGGRASVAPHSGTGMWTAQGLDLTDGTSPYSPPILLPLCSFLSPSTSRWDCVLYLYS